MQLESWRLVWRNGFVPVLSTENLSALRNALVTDDPKLLQGQTTNPPPLMCVQDWPCEGGCALGYMGACQYGGFGNAKVKDAETFFAAACWDADTQLGEPAGCRHFLNWFDDTPRDEMRAELLAEVDLALTERAAGNTAA